METNDEICTTNETKQTDVHWCWRWLYIFRNADTKIVIGLPLSAHTPKNRVPDSELINKKKIATNQLCTTVPFITTPTSFESQLSHRYSMESQQIFCWCQFGFEPSTFRRSRLEWLKSRMLLTGIKSGTTTSKLLASAPVEFKSIIDELDHFLGTSKGKEGIEHVIAHQCYRARRFFGHSLKRLAAIQSAFHTEDLHLEVLPKTLLNDVRELTDLAWTVSHYSLDATDVRNGTLACTDSTKIPYEGKTWIYHSRDDIGRQIQFVSIDRKHSIVVRMRTCSEVINLKLQSHLLTNRGCIFTPDAFCILCHGDIGRLCGRVELKFVDMYCYVDKIEYIVFFSFPNICT